MDKPISRRVHALSDLAYAPTVAAAPEMLGFRDEEAAARLCRALGGGLMASSFFTRSETGVVRVIPFKAHLAIDLVNGVFALGAPWLFGFSHNRRARNAFLAIGAMNIMAGLLTRAEEMPEAEAHPTALAHDGPTSRLAGARA